MVCRVLLIVSCLIISMTEVSQPCDDLPMIPIGYDILATFPHHRKIAESYWPLSLRDEDVDKKTCIQYRPDYCECLYEYLDGSKGLHIFVNNRKSMEAYYRHVSKPSRIRFAEEDYVSLVGVRIQYYPDCIGEKYKYDGVYPAMVIYEYLPGLSLQLNIEPNHSLSSYFWTITTYSIEDVFN